jgi:hypothetical protein
VKRTVFACVIFLSQISNAAQATVLTYNLQNVTFADGGTATGFIKIDNSVVLPTFGNTTFVVDFNISVQGGNTGLFPSFNYTPSNVIDQSFYRTSGSFKGVNISFSDIPESSRSLRLHFDTTPAAFNGLSSIALDTINNFGLLSQECFDCSPQRLIVSGSVAPQPASSVPEASTWAMLIAGFGLVGATMRRRRSVVIA